MNRAILAGQIARRFATAAPKTSTGIEHADAMRKNADMIERRLEPHFFTNMKKEPEVWQPCLILKTILADMMERTNFAEVDKSMRQVLVFLYSILLSCVGTQKDDSNISCNLLVFLRILARDGSVINDIMQEDICKFICESAQLLENSEDRGKQMRLEGVKCLINTLFNSSNMRTFFEQKCIGQLECRLGSFLDTVEYDKAREVEDEKEWEEQWFFHLRLAFILSAHLKTVQNAWRMSNMVEISAQTVEKSLETQSKGCAVISAQYGHHIRVDEGLKLLFNMLCHAPSLDKMSESDKPVMERVLARGHSLACHVLRTAGVNGEQVQNAVNLLASLPLRIHQICPKAKEDQKDHVCEGVDMTIVDVMLDNFDDKLNVIDNMKGLLGTFLTVFIQLCVDCKECRRHCRLRVLPPLTVNDVERLPDEGDTLRNKVVRLISEPSNCQTLAAEFIFVLCKRSVNRLLKYTGLGHSAGLLANSGLLGHINTPKNDSDSEDSETEEYKDIENSVNPVTGQIEHRGANPLEGMTEEQKEYEAMKLVDAMHQLMDSGVIQPGTVGEDGRPRAVNHVLELTKNVPDETEDSETDSD